MRRPEAARDGRSYLTCLIGLPPDGRAAWKETLSRSRRSKDPAAVRLKGRALSFLGRGPAALAAFEEALRLDPGSAEGWAWRGEAHLLAGRGEEARRNLDQAAALAPQWPWGRLLRAVCLLTQGDCAGAQSELAGAGEVPEALAVRALLEGQRGAAGKGIDHLGAELKARPCGPLFAVRALLRLSLRDLPGGLADLNEAAALEPSAWVLMQRADALNRSGFYKEALLDSARAATLLPDSAQPHLQAANIFFDQAFYPEALAEIEKALARSGDDPGLLGRRARFHLVLGRLAEAQAGLLRACRLAPENAQLRFEWLVVMALRGRFASVLREVRAGVVEAPYNSYLTGYVLCRRGDRARAAGHFLKAARAAEGGFAERCRFYALVCRTLARCRRRPKTRAQFYLCGVGIHHPYQVTVEILQALDECEVLYNNLGDPQVSEFLGLFRGKVQAVTRVQGEPAMGRVERIVAGLRPGKTTGFVTRIHPFIYRRIANDLVTVCRREGIGFQAFGAVSLTEVAWSLGASAAGQGGGRGLFGLRVFDLVYVVGRPDLLEPRHPVVVYCIALEDDRRRFCALVRKHYPEDQSLFLLAGSGDLEQEVVAVKVRDIEERLLAADMGAVLYLPSRDPSIR